MHKTLGINQILTLTLTDSIESLKKTGSQGKLQKVQLRKRGSLSKEAKDEQKNDAAPVVENPKPSGSSTITYTVKTSLPTDKPSLNKQQEKKLESLHIKAYGSPKSNNSERISYETSPILKGIRVPKRANP
ncbi:hypothetical protein NQ314_010614 [Rhamnusium bicolor]|uniref:Uncharacterized protein n=1 Tax=Rhamnusium bicolor TaxID=1586634 RepID=A0AAV8XS74_9CUCU|nr:hypothetical protein NQ314_010614 [Rhamnusium bicolor]